MSNANNSTETVSEALVENLLEISKTENATTLNYPINIRETEHKYELEMAAPGFKKSDFTITSEGGLLTITAVTTHEKNKVEDHYIRKEYLKSLISRAFSLPEDVLVDHVSAAYHDGILMIDLKKTDRFLIGKKHIKID